MAACLLAALYSLAVASLALGLGRGLERRYGLRRAALVEYGAALVALLAAFIWALRC